MEKVRRHLKNKNCFLNVKEMYVEFHERFFLNEIEEKSQLKNDFLNFFSSQGILIKEWE